MKLANLGTLMFKENAFDWFDEKYNQISRLKRGIDNHEDSAEAEVLVMYAKENNIVLE